MHGGRADMNEGKFLLYPREQSVTWKEEGGRRARKDKRERGREKDWLRAEEMLPLTFLCFHSLLVASSTLFLAALCHRGCFLIFSGGMVRQTCRLPLGFSGRLGARGHSPVVLVVLGGVEVL